MAKKQNLNWQALIIEEAQTEIKLTIRNNVLGGGSFLKLNKQVQDIIKEVVNELEFEELKAEARRTLNLFAEKVYKQFILDLGFNYQLLTATVKVMREGNYTDKEIQVLNDKIVNVSQLPAEIGLPNQEYHKVYIDRVKTALNNMRQIEANTPSGTSLRNLSEMQVRYERRNETINNLRESGNNLVVCSTHGNCSKRCEPWQGKYYTLNGERLTVDGKEFIPLETATDVYVTTKTGKVYKNGLLGYNCRHRILPYEQDMQIPNVSAKEIEKQRNIDHELRHYERMVRKWKEERELNKDVDRKRYLQARQKAIDWNKRYIQFAKENNRAYYPDRVKII